MALFTVSRSTLTAFKHWVTLILSIIWFTYMWFISKPQDWIVQKDYPVYDTKGKAVIENGKQKMYSANTWTEYNILRGSSLGFLLSITSGIVIDLLDFHDVIMHVDNKK